MSDVLVDADHVRVHFETEDVAARESFVGSYVVDAVERLPETGVCEAFAFVVADGDPSVDGGQVVVDAYGDADAIVDRERETWDALVADGPLTDWYRPEYDFVSRIAEGYGEDGWREQEYLRYVASRMTAATWDVLDERPAPVDAYPGSDGDPVGWHRVLHLLSNQRGYEIDEEMRAHRENLRMGALMRGRTEGVDAARAFVEDVEAELRGALAELEAEADSEGGDDDAGDGGDAGD